MIKTNYHKVYLAAGGKDVAPIEVEQEPTLTDLLTTVVNYKPMNTEEKLLNASDRIYLLGTELTELAEKADIETTHAIADTLSALVKANDILLNHLNSTVAP